MDKNILETLDNLIVELCGAVSRRKYAVNGAAELTTALAKLLLARAIAEYVTTGLNEQIEKNIIDKLSAAL